MRAALQAGWLTLAVLTVLLGTGCVSRTESKSQAQPTGTALETALAIVAHHGTAATITAQLMIRLKPADGDAVVVTTNVWSPADGRIRLHVSKVGFAGLDALVSPTGAIDAVTRDGDVAHDTADHAFADHLGPRAQPMRLIEDLKAGPLPLASVFERTATGLTCIDPGTGLRTEVDLADNGLDIIAKRWLNMDGEAVLTIQYERPQVFDGLTRSSKWTITSPTWDGVCQVRLQQIDVVPTISEERLALAIPADATPTDLSTLLDRLAGP